MAAEVSVIVPTHNRLELLQRKMAALEAQDLEPERFEVVVVADGCTDGTLAWLGAYRPPFALTVLETPGRGPAYARNRGAEAARGRVLVFSDDDTFPAPQALRRHLEAQARAPGVYVGGLAWEDGTRWRPAVRWGRVHWVSVNGANTSLPLAAFRAVGGFWEGFDGYGVEDLELGFRLARAGLRFGYLPEAWAVHAGRPSLPDLEKARSAGRQAVRAVRRHRSTALAVELGVHPALLWIKRVLFGPLAPLLGARGAYERAYLEGAWTAWRSGPPPHARDGGEA